MKFDLVIAGGEVLDPGAGLRGVMDIGIVGGKIAAVAPSLSSVDAVRTVSAKGVLRVSRAGRHSRPRADKRARHGYPYR